MIKGEHLTRRYGDFVAVDDVSFEIGAGEIVGLLGHNGAGKTTIMKILTGFLEPSAGRVLLDGDDVQEAPDVVQAKIGYLPEKLPIYPEMSVADYLAFTASMRGVPESERRPAIRRVVDATDLGGRVLDPIGTLSRGYQQRVGVAQAILHRPQVLILDEPTNGLDPSQTQHMRELIKSLAESATVILSTHIMQEVDAICNRVMILRAGSLAVDERLEDLQVSNRVMLSTSAGLDAVRAAVGDMAEVSRAGTQTALAFGNGLQPDTVDAVARALVEAKIPIEALAPERRDLELLFREVSGVQHAA